MSAIEENPHGRTPSDSSPRGAVHESRDASRRLSIVVSTPTFLPVVGGAELGIHEIYRRIGRRHDVTILTPYLRETMVTSYGAEDYADGTYTVRRIAPWIERVRPRIVARALKRTSALYIWELGRLTRRKRVDVVNVHYITPQGAAISALRRVFKVPVVLSLVGRADVVQTLGRLQRAYARFAIAEATAVLPISSFYLRSSAVPGTATVVPYGVDVDEFSPGVSAEGLRNELALRDDQPVLLCVQRLAEVKRVDHLIRALALIVERHPDTVLVIVGQGQQEEALLTLVRDLGLDKNVRMSGYVDSQDLPRYFALADMFVFYSAFETFGIVFAQAMAAGLPIVAANTSCVADVVHADNGRVVADGDLDEFSRAVEELIVDDTERSMIGARNRQRAEREFDWDRIAEVYESVLVDVAGARRETPTTERGSAEGRGPR